MSERGHSTVAVPKTRDDFLQYSLQLNLDMNTAHRHLGLSENNRKMTHIGTQQDYPYHPDRFDDVLQVLCRESVCGRSYWEIDCSENVCISVSYKSIGRKGMGDECWFGFNDQSWSLLYSSSRCASRHNKRVIELQVPMSSRIGVYVDHSAGTLSFYCVVDKMTLNHIYTFSTTFTQPLYPGFSFHNGSVKLDELE